MALPFIPLMIGGSALGALGYGINHLAQGADPQPSAIPPALQPNPAMPMPMLNNPSAMARFGVPMAPVPPKQQIGTNEMLARAGGAIMANSHLGAPQAYGAGLQAYGQMMDKNREMERLGAVDQYNAAVAQQRAAAKAGTPVAPMAADYTNAALTAIENIENAVAKAEASGANPFDDVTGIMGSVMKNLSGSNAHDVESLIQTVVSSIGFDRLQAMRDASPTGGALGQVSERELDQLNASIANLRQSQSLGQFKSNLAIVKVQLQRTVAAINAQVMAYNQMQGYGSGNVITSNNVVTPAVQAAPAAPVAAQPQAAAPIANPAPAAAPAAPGITNMAPAAPAAPAAPQGTPYQTSNGVTVTRVP